MSEDDRNEAANGATGAEKAGDARKTRGIRFSESEWEEVKNAAAAHEMPAAEFVRERILALARDPQGADRVPDSVSMMPLIERMFRYTWFLATEKAGRDAPRGARGTARQAGRRGPLLSEIAEPEPAGLSAGGGAPGVNRAVPSGMRACRPCIGRCLSRV